MKTARYLIRVLIVFGLFTGASLPCRAGRSFNGSTDSTSVPGVGNAIDLTGTAGTWSCWFNLPSLPASGNSYSCMAKTTATWSGGYAFFIQSTGVISFFFYISIPLNHSHTVACSTTVTTGHWHNAVAVYQNNLDAKIYLDGTLCGSDTGVGSTGVLVTSGLSLLLGGQLQSWSPCCTNLGLLGEIAIWNTRLSVGEIQALAATCPNSIRPSSLAGYWPFAGASGSSIEPDLSGNVLNATLTGTTIGNHPPCTPLNALTRTTAPQFGAGGGGGGGGPMNGDNLYCGSSGGTDGPATLPTTFFCTAIANTPATGSVVNVTNAAQLTTALANASCGQKITLQAGNIFSGNFTYPALSCPSSNYVWIQSSAVASLPPEGTRTSPCFSGTASLPGYPAFNCPGTPGTYTAQIVTPNSSPAFQFTTGAANVRIIGIEFTRTSGTGYVGNVVIAGNLASLSGIVFDRDWFHGNPQTDETNTGLVISATSNIGIIDSYFSDFVCYNGAGQNGCESHGILGGLNVANMTTETGQKIVNDFIAAGGQCIFFGGGAANTTPADIEIRLPACFKPLTWNPSDPSWNGGVGGGKAVVKNHIELKNAQRVLVEGFTLQNVWGGFTQTGPAFLLTPKNQAIGASNVCPNCFVANVTVRYGTINTAAVALQMAITANANGAWPASFNHLSIHDVVADNLGYSTCYLCGTVSGPIQFWSDAGVSSTQVLHDGTISHVTMVYANSASTPLSLIAIAGPTTASGNNSSNMNFLNSVGMPGSRGVNNADSSTSCNQPLGQPTAQFAACWTSYSATGNCLLGGAFTWPSGNVTSSATQATAFVNYNNGNGGNYKLSAASSCQNIGTDGKDAGADIAHVASVLAGNAP